MSRRFLDDVRSDIISLFPNNSTGQISAQDLRQVTTDMVDSCVSDECAIYSTGTTQGIALTGTFSSFATIYDAQVGGDGNFLKPAFAGGTITGSSTGGFTYRALVHLTVGPGNNERLEFAIGVNGAPAEGFRPDIVGNGADPQTVNVDLLELSARSNAIFTIMARAVDGSATIDVIDARFVVAVMPTNNP